MPVLTNKIILIQWRSEVSSQLLARINSFTRVLNNHATRVRARVHEHARPRESPAILHVRVYTVRARCNIVYKYCTLQYRESL